MDKSVNQTVQSTFKQAIKNHTENSLDVAKKLYQKVIEIDPNHEDAHNNLGIIFSNSGDLEKAKSCYEKALTINPKNFNAYNNIGNIFKELGDIEKARQNFISRQPMGRLGTSEEIAEAAVYLASNESAFITGQTIIIDGGITI